APLPRRLRARRDDGIQRNPRPGRRGLVAPGRPPAGVAGSQCRGDAGRAGVRLPPARPLGLLHLPLGAARRARGAGARPDRRRVAPLDPGRAGVVAPLSWRDLETYRHRRILTFLSPDMDPLGAGYHVVQSKIAVGSGLVWGKGFLRGTQNHLIFLPEQHTDFIFSVFAEEWG